MSSSLKNVVVHFEDVPFTSFDVTRVELGGALSELFEITIELNDPDTNVDFHALVGKAVAISMPDEPFVTTVRGVVRRVRQPTAVPVGVSAYEITVVPPHWLLTRKRDNRIFRDLTVPEIVAKVLAGYGNRIPPFADKLTRDAGADKSVHAKRDHTAQYGESDYDFVMRLLAEEGITSFFDHANASAWTLVDDTTTPGANPVAPAKIPFRAESGLLSDHHVSRVLVSSDIETSAVRVRDWDYMKPAFILQGNATRPDSALFADEGDLRDHVYEVGHFVDETNGAKRATRLLEEARSLQRVTTLMTTFFAYPGQTFTLEEHPRDDVNVDYLIVRVVYVNLGGQRTIQLEAIARTTPFRPVQRSKARIFGTQTALVVTDNEQEEISVDALGRVKLLFRWDERDQMNGDVTRWVRVSQAWAGAGFGFTMLPRRGDEVIVAFLDGDPDEPIVVGRVHNGANAPPIDLPKHKTQSAWKSRSSPGGHGFNEIMMEDLRGAELLRMRAERNFEHLTNVDASITVGNDQSTHVGAAQTTTAGSISTSSGSFIHVHAKDTIAETAGCNITMDAEHVLHARGGSSTVDLDGDQGTIASHSTALTRSSSNVILNEATTSLLESAGTVVNLYSGNLARMHGKSFAYVSSDGHAEVDAKVEAFVTAPKIEVKGTEVFVEGATKVIIKGGDIQINGGTVSIKGSQVKMHGDSTVEVDAGIIKLNC